MQHLSIYLRDVTMVKFLLFSYNKVGNKRDIPFLRKDEYDDESIRLKKSGFERRL